MIEITELQRDALAEMFNIGVGRAAEGLSSMVGEQIFLSAPEIHLLDREQAARSLFGSQLQKLSAVQRTFTGPFVAQAMLVFPENNALEIVRLMIGEHIGLDELAEFSQEAMSEIGNIVLNAIISALADLFQIEMHGSLPEHSFGYGPPLLFAHHHDNIVMVIQVDLIIRAQHIQGQIVFLLSVSSLDNLIACIDHYLHAQGLA